MVVIVLCAATLCAGLAAFGLRAQRLHFGWLALALYFLSTLLAVALR